MFLVSSVKKGCQDRAGSRACQRLSATIACFQVGGGSAGLGVGPSVSPARAQSFSGEQSPLFQEAPGDVLRVFPVLIDRAVQLPHGQRIDLAGHAVEDLAELRKPVERLGPDQRNGLVREGSSDDRRRSGPGED